MLLLITNLFPEAITLSLFGAVIDVNCHKCVFSACLILFLCRHCRAADANLSYCICFQADLLLLSSSEPHGLCYIETAELDGSENTSVSTHRTSAEATGHYVWPAVCCFILQRDQYEGSSVCLGDGWTWRPKQLGFLRRWDLTHLLAVSPLIYPV